MPKTAVCVCGQPVQIPDEIPTYAVNCPVCGRIIDTTPFERSEDGASPDVSVSNCSKDTDTSIHRTTSEILLQLLLDPKSIERLLLFGGGLSVLGLIAWLISMGVFEDPRILACALGAGTLSLLAGGWTIVLRTRYRVAGQAVTFLACVVAPLNLWFYDSQNLLTIDGHLWVGGLICSVLYLLTVWKLRDPLFLFAVEAGVTLTVMLLLGDVHYLTHASALCLAMVTLAAISIHAESAFDPDHCTFSRRRFGLPLFFSGQVQLAAGMLGLLSMQGLNWALEPDVGEWCHSQLANTPWLAGALWLTAAYLWFYSDLVVRRLSVYSYLAAIALVLAEVTLLYPFVPVEALIIGLSVTALVIPLVNSNVSNPRLFSVGTIVSSAIALIAFGLGIARHFQLNMTIGSAETSHSWLLVCAMFSVACTLCFQVFRSGNIAARIPMASMIAAGVAVWIGLMHGLSLSGFSTLVTQTPLLLFVLLSAASLAVWKMKSDSLKSVMIAICCATVLGMIVSVTSIPSAVELDELLYSFAHNRATLLSGLVFAEFAILSLLGLRVLRSNWVFVVGSVLASLTAAGKLVMYLELPEVWYGPLLAGVGFVLMLPRRILPVAGRSAEASERLSQRDTTAFLNQIGAICLPVGQLIVFFQSLPSLFGPVAGIGQESAFAVLFTVTLSIAAAILSESRSTRGWHRFAATMMTGTLLLAWIRTIHLADYQKLEVVVEVLGIAWLMAGVVGRLEESETKKFPWVSVALVGGSLCATIPVLICTMMHRWSPRGPLLGDELALLTVTILMVAIGCVLRIRSATLVGGSVLGLYLAVLFGYLAYHPQIAIGVYIAAGGAVIFATGMLLSIYRERLLALPSRVANREGVFAVINWR